MVRKIFIILSIFFLNLGHPCASDFSYVDSHAYNTPLSAEKNMTTLTRYLTKPYNSDYEKARAIAVWIGSHVEFDNYVYDNEKFTGVKPYGGDILKTRIGIDDDFADLFAKMARSAGLRARIVEGRENNKPHSWNQVYADRRWINVDTSAMASLFVGDEVRFKNNSRYRSQARRRQTNIRRNNEDYKVNKVNLAWFDYDDNSKEIRRSRRTIRSHTY